MANAPDLARIQNTLGKMKYHLSTHESICVGVSGGSDSNIIVHMIATNFREFLPKVHFVFQNTGLEYRATLRHLDYMEEHYNIHIDRIAADPHDRVVPVVRREGVPVLSKEFSRLIHYAQKGSTWAVGRINATKRERERALSPKQKALAQYLVENNIPVNDMCCNLSKKKPFHKYLKEMKADLNVSGERKSEGGQRATAHKDCFEVGKTCDKYMPLFFWDDATKDCYKESEGIRYSDCYEVWGMKRTGCVGCPYNSRVGEDLKAIKKYEPNLYKACMNVFGESYRLMDKFGVHRKKIFSDEEEPDQITFFEEEQK